MIKLRILFRLIRSLLDQEDVTILMVYHPSSKEIEMDMYNTNPDGAADLMQMSLNKIRGAQNLLKRYASKNIHLN